MLEAVSSHIRWKLPLVSVCKIVAACVTTANISPPMIRSAPFMYMVCWLYCCRFGTYSLKKPVFCAFATKADNKPMVNSRAILRDVYFFLKLFFIAVTFIIMAL